MRSLLPFITLMLTTVAFNPVAAQPAPEQTAKQTLADTVLDELCEQKWDALTKRFSPEVKAGLPTDKLKSIINGLTFVTGKFQSKGPIKTLTTKPLTVEATAYHERQAIVYRITFDDKQNIAGFFLRPAPLPKNLKNDSDASNHTGTAKSGGAKTDTRGESDVSIPREGVDVVGTLRMPEKLAAGTCPLVLFHSGSGPTDRNGNSAMTQNDAIRKLAIALADAGIASVRFDKRGSGNTPVVGREADFVPQVMVDDYNAWIELYAKDSRFTKIVLVGHSEGAHVALRAGRNRAVDSVVSIAGSGRPIDELLRQQLKGKVPGDVYDQADQILTQLKQGKTVDEVPPILASVLRPSVQPFLMDFITGPPEPDAAALTKPLLIVQGDRDIQVSVDDAKRLDKAAPRSKRVIITGMNHVLVDIPSPDKQLASYNDPTLPLSPQLVPTLVEFIKSASPTGN
ncbi:MAG: alpha/beta fold hydrolase [Planctomycetota bacterium]